MTSPSNSERWQGRFDALLTFGVSIVFVALWAGVVYTLLVDPTLPEAAWVWIRGLEPLIQVMVWVATLPIPVSLWIATSSLPPIVAAGLWLGVVAWTFVAVAGLARKLKSR